MNRPHLLLVIGATLATSVAFADGSSDVSVSAATRQPSLTIMEQRLTDERIQAAVMNVIAGNRNLSGRVVVESKDQVVNLSGHLMTSGQVHRAGRDAGKVTGVRYVVNEIRPLVGVVTN